MDDIKLTSAVNKGTSGHDNQLDVYDGDNTRKDERPIPTSYENEQQQTNATNDEKR